MALKDSLQQMFQEIATKLEVYPDVFRPAAEKMIVNYKKISTDSHLEKAMHNFGKFVGVMALPKRGAKRKNHGLQMTGVGNIHVQPTAQARRLPHMGRGGRRLHNGRPKKSRSSGPKQSSLCQAVLPPRKKRRVRAPHNLSQVVSQNQSLGKTHSSK